MKKKLVATALAAAVTLSACPFSAAALSPSLRGSLKSVSFFSSFEGGTLDGETANGKALNLGFEQTRSTAAAALGAEISVGPDVNNCGKAKVGYSGAHALKISGQKSDGPVKNNAVIFSGLNIRVFKDMQLSYMIFPDYVGENDEKRTGQYLSVDLKFTDGTFLSDLSAVDINGHGMDPLSQGKANSMYRRQWNHVCCSLYETARGKTVDSILVSFESEEAADELLTYIDDIKIQTVTPEQKSSPADYVLTTRGTDNNGAYSHGQTYPAVSVPNGFNAWTPFTGTDKYLYTYASDSIQAFGTSHQANIALIDYGVFQFMPNVWERAANEDIIGAKNRASSFSHQNETAKAHYYSVTFDGDTPASGVKVEMTPTDHAAVIKMTYPSDSPVVNVIFDSFSTQGDVKMGGNIEFDGSSFTAVTDYSVPNVAIQSGFNRMFVYGEFVGSLPQRTDNFSDSAGRPLAMAQFASGTGEVIMKIATSYISAEQAKKNLSLEISETDTFDTVMERAKAQWNEIMNTVEVDGASEQQLERLYSSLYKMYLFPKNYSENAGTAENPQPKYASPYKSTADNIVVNDGQMYAGNGFWDTYRTEWPALFLLSPKKAGELLDGMLEHYRDAGKMPRWSNPGGILSMIATNFDAVFGDAASKGIEFDTETAYEASLRAAASCFGDNGYERNYSETAPYIGYTQDTGDGGNSSISWTLEAAINDAGIANLAKALGDNDGYEYFKNRSKNHANLFNSELGFYMPKNGDGSFTFSNEEFDPYTWQKYGFVETNGWGMSVYETHDVKGMINLYGGYEKFAAKLDEILSAPAIHKGSEAQNHEIAEAKDVGLGQYQHNNQPTHAMLYLYNYAGKAYKTQSLTRQVLDRFYNGGEIGHGYIGDEDNGEQSAWYLLSSLGFYAANAGSDEYCITSPLYSDVTLHLPTGDVHIKANNNSAENVYIQSMTVDGKDYTKCYITHSELTSAKEIVFNMGSTPSDFGCNTETDLPSSVTEGDEIDIMEDVTTGMQVSETADMSGDCPLVFCENMTDGQKLFCNLSYAEQSPSFSGNSASITMYMPTAQTLRQYTLTSKSKSAAPESITVYGSADGKTWEKLDERQNQSFRWDLAINFYAVDNTKAYNYYRLDIENKNVENIELCELQLICGEVKETDAVGDADLSGDVTVTDALLVLQNAVGKIEFTERQKKACDTDGDGRITVSDALTVLQIAVGKIKL